MSTARRHYLLSLRQHLWEDVRDRPEEPQGRRAKFLLDHLAEHLAPVDWRLIEEIEAAMRSGG